MKRKNRAIIQISIFALFILVTVLVWLGFLTPIDV